MFMRPRADDNLDLRVRLRKVRQVVFQECTVVVPHGQHNPSLRPPAFGGVLLHPLRTPRPIAVVKFETFALQHERADTVLAFRHEAEGVDRHCELSSWNVEWCFAVEVKFGWWELFLR
jgi:hypothetical protein